MTETTILTSGTASTRVRHELIVAHDVVMTGSGRQQLSAMALKAKAAIGADGLEVLADRGYFSGEEILACERAGITQCPSPSPRAPRDEPVRQAGLHLYSRPGCLSLPRRPAPAQAHDDDRERTCGLVSCQACAIKPQYRGAPLRHQRSLVRLHPLDETAEERPNRDQPPRPPTT